MIYKKKFQKIWLDDFFSVYLVEDDAMIEQVFEDLIKMYALDTTNDNNVDDVSIIKSILK